MQKDRNVYSNFVSVYIYYLNNHILYKFINKISLVMVNESKSM